MKEPSPRSGEGRVGRRSGQASDREEPMELWAEVGNEPGLWLSPPCPPRKAERVTNRNLARLREGLEAPEGVRHSRFQAWPDQQLYESSPPPGREGEVSAVLNAGLSLVDRGAGDGRSLLQPKGEVDLEDDPVVFGIDGLDLQPYLERHCDTELTAIRPHDLARYCWTRRVEACELSVDPLAVVLAVQQDRPDPI